jgi:hypothetical protein
MSTYEDSAIRAQAKCAEAVSILAAYQDEIAEFLEPHIRVAGILDYLTGIGDGCPAKLALRALVCVSDAQTALRPYDDHWGQEIRRHYLAIRAESEW